MKKYLIVCLLLFGFTFGCGAPDPQDEGEREVYLVYTDWAESVALTTLSEVLLSDYLGYKVTTRLTGVDTVFSDIASGRADVFMDVWVPHTHAGFMEMYSAQLENLGPNYNEARTGLAVPEYMAVESIPGLENYYSNPIAGIDTSAGIMRNTVEALRAYQLDNELLVMSDPEMSEKLGNAIRRRENIVVTGWEPHWIFHRYDLKFLDDPLEVYMEEESIHTYARTGFSEEHPNAVILFERMVLSERQINSLLYEIHLGEDPYEAVREWIRQNEFVVNQWTRGLSPEREKIM